MCGLCEELCPTQAITAETGTADKNKCNTCLRCVAICLEGVLQINDMSKSWPQKLAMHGLTKEKMQQEKSRIFI
jgi:Fe-S-cluster-containing hydrogenase component 2